MALTHLLTLTQLQQRRQSFNRVIVIVLVVVVVVVVVAVPALSRIATTLQPLHQCQTDFIHDVNRRLIVSVEAMLSTMSIRRNPLVFSRERRSTIDDQRRRPLVVDGGSSSSSAAPGPRIEVDATSTAAGAVRRLTDCLADRCGTVPTSTAVGARLNFDDLDRQQNDDGQQ